METPSKEPEEKRSTLKTISYGILLLIVILAVTVLVAKYAFNIDLVNFDQLLGARISKTDLLKLQ
jgi:hypothetical protein